MRRSWFKEVVCVVLVLAVVATLGATIANRVRMKNWYGMAGVVTHISEATDTVTIEDYNGNLWQFKGVEDWSLGDVASCIMDSKGTVFIKDDEIVKVQYSGAFEGWQ